jgi:hypothetical protein
MPTTSIILIYIKKKYDLQVILIIQSCDTRWKIAIPIGRLCSYYIISTRIEFPNNCWIIPTLLFSLSREVECIRLFWGTNSAAASIFLRISKRLSWTHPNLHRNHLVLMIELFLRLLCKHIETCICLQTR